MFGWLKKLLGNEERYVPGPGLDANEESYRVADVAADQTEFKTYGEAMSWIMKTGQFGIFNWDEKKQAYVRSTPRGTK